MAMESFGAAWRTLPHEPFHIDFLYSSKGLQYLHIYLWLFVDISWMQGFSTAGDFFGFLLVFVSWTLFLRAIASWNYDDIFICLIQFIWLCSNVWWMSGEVHDIRYPNSPKIYDIRAVQSSYALIVAFLLASVYFIIVKPSYYVKHKNLADSQQKQDTSVIEDTKIPQKMLCFPRFKDYERIHLLFWIGKDCAWCLLLGPIWIIFFVPTYFMALDYALITMNRNHLLIEHTHYLTQFFWVTANGIWAFGEIYSIHDAPMDLFSRSAERWITCRWYACWIMTLALVPIIVMYTIWITQTYRGKIVNESFDSIGRESYADERVVPDSHEAVMDSLLGLKHDRYNSSADFALDIE